MSPDGTCVRCRREADEAADALEAARVRRRQTLVVAGTAAAALIAGAIAFAVQLRGRPVHAAATATAAASAPSGTSRIETPLAPLEPAKVVAEPAAQGATAAATPLDRAMHAVPITLYCRPPPECERARAWLRDGSYLYRERNVDVDPTAAAAWKRIAPDGTVPAFDVDGQTFAGFDPDRVTGALEYAGARRLQR